MPAPSVAVLAAAALLGGAAAGVGLERAGVLSPLAEPEAAAVRSEVVELRDCPDGTVVAALARGDRVVATGRSDDGAWIEIRSPLGLDRGAWLPAATLSADDGRDALDGLPERRCELERPTTTTSSTTTSTTTSTTSTTVPETTTTTEPAPPPPPTTRPRPTTTTTATTVPLDTSPPVIGTIQRSEVVVRETGCGVPTSSVIQVPVTDDRAQNLVVSMTFAGNGQQGPVSGPLQGQSRQGSFFFGTFGPFGQGTAPAGGAMVATITVTASDGVNQTQASTTVELRCS